MKIKTILTLMSFIAMTVNAQETTESAYRFKPTHNLIRTDVGVGFTSTNVDFGSYKKPDLTYGDLKFDYEHTFGDNDSQGFGINYFRCGINGGNGEGSSYYSTPDDTGFDIVYIGASYVANYTTTKGWNWSCAAGIGYAGYSDVHWNNNGFGFLFRFGGDYKICRYVGIGFDAAYYSCAFNFPEHKTVYEGKARFNLFSINIGPRFYF